MFEAPDTPGISPTARPQAQVNATPEGQPRLAAAEASKMRIFEGWLARQLELEGAALTRPEAARVALISRAFLTLIIAFIALHLALVALAGFNRSSALFTAASAGCAVLVFARWLIGRGWVRTGTWLGVLIPLGVGLVGGWATAFIGVAQAAWIFVGVTYCTFVLGFRAGALAAVLSLVAYAALAWGISYYGIQPRMVSHPFNQWLNLFTPSMVLLVSTGLLRETVVHAITSQLQSAAAAQAEREERLRLAAAATETLEETVRDRTRNLERAIKDLQTVQYLISHDLSGKLTSIRSFSDLVVQNEAGRLSAAGNRWLGRITDNADELQGMIDGLLVYSRTTALEPSPSTVALDDLVDAIAADDHVARWGVRVTSSAGQVTGDATMLRHVMQNLISNACRYASTGARKTVEVTREVRGREDVICVADTGPGFDPRDSARLFELFQRGQDELAGHGVGLAVVNYLVTRLGGRAWAETGPAGAQFFFTLPRG